LIFLINVSVCSSLLESEAQAEITKCFTLWQQATIEITPHAHFALLVRATYIYSGMQC